MAIARRVGGTGDPKQYAVTVRSSLECGSELSESASRLAHLKQLSRFLHDGRIELDNNPVERAIRPVALGRKNHLFAGSDGGGIRWATVCSLVATAKLNDVEPFAYLKDVLERMTNGHPMSRLDDLLPWNWTQLKAAADHVSAMDIAW